MAGHPTAEDETDGDGTGEPTAGAPPLAVRLGLVAGALALVVGAIVVVVLVRDRSSLNDEVDRLTTKLEIARGDAGAEISGLEADIELLEAELATTSETLELTTDELSRATTEVGELTSRLDQRSDELAAARETIQELEEEFEQLRELVGDNAVAMPDFLGADPDQVVEFADELGAILLVEEADPTNVIGRPGSVIEQFPEPGVVIAPGSVIWIQLFAPGVEPG